MAQNPNTPPPPKPKTKRPGRPPITTRVSPQSTRVTVKGQSVAIPGAANAVFLLGSTLAVVALWSDVIVPFWDRAWNGDTSKKYTLPPSGIISLVLFILFLTFVSSLSPDFAQVAFLFVIGLWIVYLVMNPQVVQNAAGFISQGNNQQQQQQGKTPGKQVN